MPGPARVMVIALDATEHELVAELAASGDMPTFARLLREAAAVDTLAPPGVFVTSNWPTIFTARRPDRHGYLCWEEIPIGTYGYRQTTPREVDGVPVWRRLSDAGRRVAVLDVPHTIPEPLNGVMVSEWGCHDRHFGPGSFPEEAVDELTARHGAHPNARPHLDNPQFAPCDYSHRAGEHRTPEETEALVDALRAGIEQKRRASLELLDRGGWDLFWTVMGESHCVGHQLWHLHDPAHPKHDAALVERLGGDPVRDVYRRLDAVVGDHLERLGPDDTAYVLLPHGMTAHNDGTHLLDHVLHRLDWGLDHPGGLGGATRAADAAARLVPPPLRPRALRAAAPLLRRRGAGEALEPLPPRADRRWFQIPNNTVVGAVRLNLAGREPAGRIAPEDRKAVLRWLATRLEELVNVDTGGPVVRKAWVTDDVYRRTPGDTFGDLHVEWEREAPIERVWSPAVGTVAVPYEHWRQGDHVREGTLFAVGGGIRPGRRGGAARPVEDVGATFAAALGVPLPDADGTPIASLLPAGAPRPSRRPRLRSLRPALPARRPPAWARREDPILRGQARRTTALEQRLASAEAGADREAADTARQLEAADRRAQIATMARWLEHTTPAPGTLVSVVTPTRDRRALVAEAVASVRAQSYGDWELLVVDDGPTDGVADDLAALEDPRIRRLSTSGGVGACAARNVALDAAQGELVVYLDDDNRFDPHWLAAVVGVFRERPDATVAYGARIVDDGGRLLTGAPSGTPWLQFEPWDREVLRHGNMTDMGVIAHRAGPVRFDEALSLYGDWDLLLHLTRDGDPVEIPAVAVYYRTDSPDRLSDRRDEIEARDFRRVRARHGVPAPD